MWQGLIEGQGPHQIMSCAFFLVGEGVRGTLYMLSYMYVCYVYSRFIINNKKSSLSV